MSEVIIQDICGVGWEDARTTRLRAHGQEKRIAGSFQVSAGLDKWWRLPRRNDKCVRGIMTCPGARDKTQGEGS